MRDNPDQCVASRQKTLCVYFQHNGQWYRMIASAHVIAGFLGVKWETVKKRRLRGSPWSKSFRPTDMRVECCRQGHSI
jgi:transposase-like protein